MKGNFKSLFTVFLSLTVLCSGLTVQVKAEEPVIKIDECDGYITYLESSDGIDYYVTYENGIELFRSYVGNDGNVYQITGDDVYVAVSVEETGEHENILTSNKALRAPSVFTLVKTENGRGITIAGSVVEAGKAAIRNALIGFMWGYITGKTSTAAFTGAAANALQSLIDYIWVNAKPFTSTTVIKHYVYSGCDWLRYVEFSYQTGHTIGMYSWKDNPQLGVAPYACKMANLSYPY